MTTATNTTGWRLDAAARVLTDEQIDTCRSNLARLPVPPTCCPGYTQEQIESALAAKLFGF